MQLPEWVVEHLACESFDKVSGLSKADLPLLRVGKPSSRSDFSGEPSICTQNTVKLADITETLKLSG
jgi:hypothetical protein